MAVCCATSVVHGKELTVGDNKRWSFGSRWENGKFIQSGRRLHNPVCTTWQVGEGDYNSCTVSGPPRRHLRNDYIQLAPWQSILPLQLPATAVRA
ncbi:hypothetical protein ZWY2020_019750 [Hordeum vulgare]|nr:hypothetical protein ZWY2020_019750 [Hordeum vulgare]